MIQGTIASTVPVDELSKLSLDKNDHTHQKKSNSNEQKEYSIFVSDIIKNLDKNKAVRVSDPIEIATYSRSHCYEYSVNDKSELGFVSNATINSFRPTSATNNNLLNGYNFGILEEKFSVKNWSLEGLVKSIDYCNDNVEEYRTSKLTGNIVGFRNSLFKLFMLPYKNRESLDYILQWHEGNLYVINNEDQDIERKYYPENHLKFIYSGFKFENFLINMSNRENREMDNSQFCTVVKRKFNDISVIIRAEVDCAIKRNPSSNQYEYVELKTHKYKRHYDFDSNYNAKLFLVWSQCFLANINQIIFGLRNNSNFNLIALKKYHRNEVLYYLKQNTPYGSFDEICTKFYYFILNFILTKIGKDDKLWSLKFDSYVGKLTLKQIDSKIGLKNPNLIS
ncbi:DXO/RAI1 family decapping nuclease ASCRUDRAFT_8533 [Ascoidea rubescens DSM 1968]|uniref:Decapping nuclease n=1 Tax=Ascoidea rubescens DSM 1968 TaxID=1344418 RepID=A0A1D2VFM5_9ASCO|nr:hypothetical protein ASCRUDRAFT_8533 [Ascoidea rubescens DSM 1968]ODV60277.1 hypothetical protein ASCRUDRAFT_8533 [Ascoidea rubescens DSM 1968]